jgi:hypothetical protein
MSMPTSLDRNEFDRSRRPVVGSASWVAWLPLVFVGAMLFWTLALGLGGLSLVTLTALSADDDSVQLEAIAPPPTAAEPMPGTIVAADGIVVNLQESPEPEDVNDNAGQVPPSQEVLIEAGP